VLLYERLRPWSSQIVYTGISAWGDVDHALGKLASTLGDYDAAGRHLEASRDRARLIGATIWVVRASIDLSRLLLKRGAPADIERAIELLDAAAADGRRFGADRMASAAKNLRSHAQAQSVIGGARGAAGRLRLRHGAAPPGAAEAGGAGDGARPSPAEGGRRRAVIRCEGDTWAIIHRGRTIRLRDAKGVRYLAEMLTHPGVERHAADLQGGPAGSEPGFAVGVADGLSVHSPGTADAGPILDEEAKSAYRQRIDDLREEIAEAEAFNDPERVARAREELDLLGRELSAAVGIGGRDRMGASGAERARVNVTRALRKTVERIAELDVDLGEHLRRSVRTGSFCAYEPAPGEALAWETESAAAR
jgi:hypothetical protein